MTSGTQYRSVIFTHSEQQRKTAQEVIAEVDSEACGRPVVTQVMPATTFYKAEEYHQEYFENNPQQGYCAFVVAPKLKKFREKFAESGARA